MQSEISARSATYQVSAPMTDRPRTYVIIGTPRGGTSMIAGLARLCGLELGDDLRKNHEDPDFNFELLVKANRDPVTHMLAAIDRRNAQHTVWGWKYPRAVRYLDELRPRLRNPHLVVVIRDPVAAAGRLVARQGLDPLRAITARHELIGMNLDLVQRWNVPALIVSYERAVEEPHETAGHLGEFLGMAAPTEEQVTTFVQPGSYQPIPGA